MGTWARYANVAAGTWLFVSGLWWLQPAGPRLNALVIGLMIAGVSVWSLWAEEARFIDSALSVWLVFSTLAIFDVSGAALWNDLIVAVLVFALSLVANEEGPPRWTIPPSGSVRGA